MAATPISKQVFNISRSALDGAASTLAAIDRGCSLTKAVYVSKSGEGDTATHYALHCVVFANSDFEGCMHFLKENALLPSSGSIRVTGVGCEKYKDTVERILGLKVEFIDEFLSTFRGVYFFLSNIDDRESAFYPQTDFNEGMKIKPSQDMEALMKEMVGKYQQGDKGEPGAQFPCVLVIIGSGVMAMSIDTEGKTKITGISMVGGKTLMGMGRALAGTAKYDELLELAKNGNCGNIDTIVEEFMKEDPNSSYGRFPPKLPLFPFGKLVDHEEEICDYKREDRAAAVVRMVAMSVANLVGSSMAQSLNTRVVIGGHGARGEALRTMMFQYLRGFAQIPIDMKFLKTGATGAIGAMIAKPDDMKKFMTM